MTLAELGERHELQHLFDDPDVAEQVEIGIKYEGYLELARQRLERAREEEATLIPEGFAYEEVTGLRNEAKAKLSAIRPRSLGQAARVPGITPADLQVLAIFVARARRQSA